MQVRPRRGEVAVAAFLLAVAGFFMWGAFRMPSGAPGMPGAGTMPLIIASLLAIVSVVLLVKSHIARIDQAPVEMRFAPVAIVYAALVAVAVALERAGFIVTLSVFLFVMLRVFSKLSTLRSAAAAIGITLVATWFFVNLLGVSLPRW